MNSSQVYINRIIELLDDRQMVYIERSTSYLIAIPEDEDFMDFGDDNFEEVLEEIEARPDAYVRLTMQSSRELYNTMMDFSQEQEKRDLTSLLVKALRMKDGVVQFNNQVKKLQGQLNPDWESYYYQQRFNRFKRLLCKEKIKPIIEKC